jgi:hypothetical protein
MSLTVGKTSVLKYLRRMLKIFGVGLLDLVDEHHRKGPSDTSVRLPALLESYIAWRGADSLAPRGAPELAHFERTKASSLRRGTPQGNGKLSLPTPVGQEEEASNGPLGS